MSNNGNSSTCMVIGLIIAAIIVGVLGYYIGTVQPLWVAVVAFLILLALGLWLVQKLCGGSKAETHERGIAAVENAPAPVPAPTPEVVAAPKPEVAEEPEPVVEAVVEATPEPAPEPATAAAQTPAGAARPEALAAARDGKGDDLKKIKGVGAKMAQMLNGMGFYHFDQIAAWSDTEVVWVDENLQGFKGRVTRDNWVEQAKTLAEGGTTEFSKKVDKGGVY